MSGVETRTPAPVDRAFLVFAAVFFVFHQLPSVLFAERVEAAVDVLTPFAVAASTVAVMVALGASRGPILAAVAAGFGKPVERRGRAQRLDPRGSSGGGSPSAGGSE